MTETGTGSGTNLLMDLQIGSTSKFHVTNVGYVKTTISTLNCSNPPTDAELDAAFGTPATVGAGFQVIIDDQGGNTNEYYVWSDGTKWFYATGTAAT